MASINTEIASQLWNATDFNVERFHAKVQPGENVDFLGHVDLTIDARRTIPGLVLRLRGIQVKILKGNNRLDMPTEKGNDGKYYPKYFPLSAELRECMTIAVFRHADVDAAVQSCKAIKTQATGATPAASGSGDNPFPVSQ